MVDGRAARHSGLHRAGARAARTGQIAGSALIAVLCAGAMAPVLTADVGLGAMSSAVTALVGSVGGNVATDLLVGAAQRLRGRAGSEGIEQEALERALAEAIETALVGGGAAGTAMLALAAGILREAGAVQAVLAGAASADPVAAGSVAAGLAGLGEQFGELTAEVKQWHASALALQREMITVAAERRETAARDRQLGLLAAQLAEALDASAFQQGADERKAWRQCPYPGLAPFGEGDARVFFGRREMTRRLVHAVAERTRVGGLLMVLGASGAGKSSLLRAGLVPALARDVLGPGSGAWPVRVITPTENPIVELAALLAALSNRDVREVEQLLRVAPHRAADLAADAVRPFADRVADMNPVLVLVVDQLEQLFTLAPVDQHAPFLRALHALFTPCASPIGVAIAPPAVVLAAVRSDYLDQAAADPHVAAALADGPFVVNAMTHSQLRQAIEGPATEAGVPIERNLVTTILKEALADSGAGVTGGQVLPLVSQALAETWRIRHGATLTLHAYNRAGGLADAADRSAQEVYDHLDERSRRAARAMFTMLTRVSVDGRVTRRTVARQELHAVSGLSASESDSVIDAFTQRRLLVAEHGGIAICHDVLLDAWRLLSDWLKGDAADRALYSDLIADADKWNAHGRTRDFLYRRQQLASALAATARWSRNSDRFPELPETCKDFLSASERSTRNSTWIRRGVAVAMAVLTLVSLVGTVTARIDNQRLTQQRADADAAAFTAVADRLRTSDPTLAAEFDIAAYHAAPSTTDQMALINDQDTVLSTIVAQDVYGNFEMAFTADDQTLIGLNAVGTVNLWNIGDHMRAAPLDAQFTAGGVPGAVAGEQFDDMAFDSAHNIIAAASTSHVSLWSVANPKKPAMLARFGVDANQQASISLALSPNGRLLAVCSDDVTTLWSVFDPARPSRLGSLPCSTQLGVWPLEFGDRGRLLMVEGTGNGPALWNVTDPDTPSSVIVPGGPYDGFVIDPSRPLIFASRLNASGILWNLTDSANPSPISTNSGKTYPYQIDQISFNGRFALFGSDTAAPRLYNFADPANPIAESNPLPLYDVKGQGSSFFSPDTRFMATSTLGGKIRVWNLSSAPGVISAFDDGFANAALSRDGRIVATSSHGSLALWDVNDPSHPRPLGPPIAAGDKNLSLMFSPDSHTLAVGDPESLTLWDISNPSHPTVESKPVTGDAMGYVADVHWAAFTANGRQLVVTNSAKRFSIWDVTHPRAPTQLGAYHNIDAESDIMAIAADPNSHFLAIGVPGNFQIWNIADPIRPALISTTSVLPDLVRSLAFSMKGQLLGIGTTYGNTAIWNISNPRQPKAVDAAMTSADNNWRKVAFSPDGRLFASTTGGSGTALLWDTSDAAHPVSEGEQLVGAAGGDAVAFSADGRILLVGDTVWSLNPEATIQYVCSTVGNALDSQLWKQYLPNIPYNAPCPN